MSGVRQTKVIGYSVQGRPITAYELGNPKAPTKDLVLGSMHGYYERAGEQVVSSIKSLAIPNNLDLWVIPTINPDGDALGQRANAHNVDLNRDWPNLWQHIAGKPSDKFDNHGNCSCGPLSQPETRAMQKFLQWLKPSRMVSLHQPLDGVDLTDGGSLPHGKAFRDALARNLNLPEKALTCFGGCHGSMTGWLTNYTHTVAITVEFGSSPGSSYLQGQTARGIISALDLGVKAWTAPKPKAIPKASGFLDKATTTAGAIRVQGWSLDPQYSSPSNWVTVLLDGRTVAHLRANQVRGDVNRRVHVVGRHGFLGTIKATPGRHTVCVVGMKYASSTTKSVTLARGCKTVSVPPFLLSGHVDQVTGTAGGIHITGWAYDPQHREATRTVRILLDGRAVANVQTSKLRTSVNQAIHLTGTHGFDTVVKAGAGGHTVQVVAIPTGAMTSHAKVLITTAVTVPAA